MLMGVVTRRARFVTGILVGGLLLAACGTSGGEADPEPADANTEADGGDAGSEGDAGSDGGPGEDLAEAEAFYEGKTVTLIVCYDPGGGFDLQARWLAPYLAEELGAEVVVDNQPGGGGLVATNSVLMEPNPDGTTLLTCSGTGTFSALLAELPEVAFTFDDIAWIGRFADAPQVISAAEDGPFGTWDDVLESDNVRFGAEGPGSGTFYHSTILNQAFDLGGEIVVGFDGGPEIALAVLREDVNLHARSSQGEEDEASREGHMPILTLGEERVDYLPDVPTVFEYELDPEWEEVLRAHAIPASGHFPLLTNAGVPEDRLQVLRNAFMDAAENPDYLAEVDNAGGRVNPASGEFMQELSDRLRDAPEKYLEVLKATAE